MNGIIMGDRVILGQQDGNLTIFNKNDGLLLNSLKASEHCVNCVIKHQDHVVLSAG